jgi:hypothetical protein
VGLSFGLALPTVGAFDGKLACILLEGKFVGKMLVFCVGFAPITVGEDTDGNVVGALSGPCSATPLD